MTSPATAAMKSAAIGRRPGVPLPASAEGISKALEGRDRKARGANPGNRTVEPRSSLPTSPIGAISLPSRRPVPSSSRISETLSPSHGNRAGSIPHGTIHTRLAKGSSIAAVMGLSTEHSLGVLKRLTKERVVIRSAHAGSARST